MKNTQLLAIIAILIASSLSSCENEQKETDLNKSFLDNPDFIKDGLVAYYNFNGDINDISGNELNGIPFNVSYTNDRFLNEEGACHFNGEDSYITIENSELLNNDEYTIVYWYRPNLKDTLQQSIISKSDTSKSGYTISVYSQDHYAYSVFHMHDKLGLSENSSSVGPNVRVWYPGVEQEFKFFAIAFSSTKIIDYLGGKEITRSPNILYNDNEFNLYIGSSLDQRFKRFSGDIDELLIYNRILTFDEIEKLSNWNLN